MGRSAGRSIQIPAHSGGLSAAGRPRTQFGPASGEDFGNSPGPVGPGSRAGDGISNCCRLSGNDSSMSRGQVGNR